MMSIKSQNVLMLVNPLKEGGGRKRGVIRPPPRRQIEHTAPGMPLAGVICDAVMQDPPGDTDDLVVA